MLDKLAWQASAPGIEPSLDGLCDAATLQLLLLCLNNYFGNDVRSLGKNSPGIHSPLAKSYESNVSLCGLFACFGCCLATRPISNLLSKHGVADLAGKHRRSAHAGSRTPVTIMAGLYDTATLHALLLLLRLCNKNRDGGRCDANSYGDAF